jgi:hypothetical protein
MVADTAAPAEPLTPLSAGEQKTLEGLLARHSAGKAPTARIGDAYEALIALSVPRRGDKDRQTDLVYPGEIIYLTEEEARQFERHGTRDGRQVPVIRKLSGPDGSREPLPRLLPRHVSGRLFRPAVPPPGSELPRPDPEGSSRIEVIDDGGAPETEGAATAAPGEMADQLQERPVDAMDLPPSRSRRRAQ